MEILLRLSRGTGDPLPLRCEVADDATIGELADNLARWIGSVPGATIDGLPRDALVRETAPRSGSLITLSDPPPGRDPTENVGTALDDASPTSPVRVLFTKIDGSPSSDERTLGYGSTDLGPVELMVSEEVELLPRPGTRVWINGRRAIGSCRIHDGDLVSISITGPVNDTAHQHDMWSFAVEVCGNLARPDDGPFVPHRSTTRIHDELVATTIPGPSTPDETRVPGLPVVSAVVPLIFGAVLWATTRSIATALFVLFSFLYIAAAGLETRLEFRKDIRHRERGFRRATERAVAQLVAANRDEVDFIDRTTPDPAVLGELVESRDPRIWERRPDDTTGGFLRVRIGVAVRPGASGVERPVDGRSDLLDWFTRKVEAVEITDLPVAVDLDDGGGIGLIATDGTETDLARWIIVQLSALVGPDLLRIAVCADDGRVDVWDWTAWLPHTGVRSGRPWTVIVVDGADESDLRLLIGESDPATTRFVWLARHRRDLPPFIRQSLDLTAATTLVAARGTDTRTFSRIDLDKLRCDGLSHRSATELALGLTPLVQDHVLASTPDAATGSPTTLGTIIGRVELDDADSIVGAWESSRHTPGLSAPIGRSGSGVFDIDLGCDGPHALIAGTTGAGKSELLRTWLLSLALHHPPDEVTFLLIDYKGGSAFGPLTGLPHSVGLITDLDADLAARAIVSLRAELRVRESWLADIGASSMTDTVGMPDRPPALVVVVDEFATLAKELPDMVDELVDIAQRGRSLGIHLILATQRPHGVVSEAIRANTSIRVALRVADTSDSSDVIDVPDAASIPRTRPGAALVRIDQATSGVVQFAYSSGPLRDHARVTTQLISTTRRLSAAPPSDGITEIEVATCSIRAAFESCDRPLPRRPWVAPLDHTIPLETIYRSRDEHLLTIGLKDRPDRQCVEPLTLDLDRAPGIVVFGIPGQSRTTTLSTIAEALAHSVPGTRIYSIGTPIEHTTDDIDLDDVERVMRLLRQMIDRIRDTTATDRVVVIIDDIAAFENHYAAVDRGRALDLLERICRHGAHRGVNIVVGASRRMDLPSTIAVGFVHRIVLGLGSADEASLIGAPTAIAADLPIGRGIHEGHWIQIGLGRGCGSCGFVAREPVRRLPEVIPLGLTPDESRPDVTDDDPVHWRMVVGLATDDLTVRHLDLRHDHALVAGTRRSGVTSALETIAEAWKVASVDRSRSMAVRIGTTGTPADGQHRSPWDRDLAVGSGPSRPWDPVHLEKTLDLVLTEASHGTAILVAVDDLPAILDGAGGDDVEQFLEHLSRTSSDHPVRIVVGGEIEAVARSYSPTLGAIRAGRTGILLRPDPDIHGSLLGCELARRDDIPGGPGRGWLVQDGVTTSIQMAVVT